MAVTFDTVTLIDASKLSNTYPVLANETVLLSGKRAIQASTEYGFSAIYSFLGTWSQVAAILAKVGAAGTLTDNETSYTNCYIYGDIKIEETDSPGYYTCQVGFRQDTR